MEVKKDLTKFRIANLVFTVIARLRPKSLQSNLYRLLRSTKSDFSLTRNDGLSEYCENIFIKELRILNGVVFASF